jgi:hypothetical protein
MLAPIKKNVKVRLAKADRAHNKFTLPLAVFCFFFFPLCAQWVFAADVYIYKDKSGVLTFTSVAHARGIPKGYTKRGQARNKHAVVESRAREYFRTAFSS